MEPRGVWVEILEPRGQIRWSKLGSRVRRWWWEVNNWEVPKETKRSLASEVEDVRRGPVRIFREFMGWD